MKSLILIALVLLSSQLSLACLGEAQIVAEVNGVTQTEKGNCAISISAPSVSFYHENQTCPLFLEDVLISAFEVSAKPNGACVIYPGDSISGVLVLDHDGKITLE